MRDIAELLLDAPTGIKLYCPIWGEVIFQGISDDINILTDKGEFDGYGRKDTNGECILFPSRDRRDWEEWQEDLMRPNDVVSCDEGVFIYVGTIHYNVLSTYNMIAADGKQLLLPVGKCQYATQREADRFFKTIKSNGLQWNSILKKTERILATPEKPKGKENVIGKMDKNENRKKKERESFPPDPSSQTKKSKSMPSESLPPDPSSPANKSKRKPSTSKGPLDPSSQAKNNKSMLFEYPPPDPDSPTDNNKSMPSESLPSESDLSADNGKRKPSTSKTPLDPSSPTTNNKSMPFEYLPPDPSSQAKKNKSMPSESLPPEPDSPTTNNNSMPSETPPALAEQGMNSQNQEVKTDGSKNEWKRFVELAEMYKKEGKCITNTQVNVTVALKNTFEHLRLSGIYVPIKSIVSAALHAFLENNAGEIQKMDNPKLQSSVELLMKNMCESNELNNKTP